MKLQSPQEYHTQSDKSWAFAEALQKLMIKHGVDCISHYDNTSNYGIGGSHDVVIEFSDYRTPDMKFSSLYADEELAKD